ncbi:MAG: PqqD family protein [Armatimonadota bacterium]
MVATEIGSEGVLLDLDSKEYYSLNKTAMVIWNLLAEERTLPEMAEALHKQFRVSMDDAHASADRFVQSLAEGGLVRAHGSAPAPEPRGRDSP